MYHFTEFFYISLGIQMFLNYFVIFTVVIYCKAYYTHIIVLQYISSSITLG